MKAIYGLVLVIFLSMGVELAQAQYRQTPMSQQFRLGERIIRIAEPGELADSVNVWGDVGSSGRYLVPKGTTLPLLLSYSFGPQTLRDGQTNLDWSKMRVEINIQEFNQDQELVEIKKFEYHFEEPFPDGMYTFELENNHTVTVRVKRRPSFRDYLGVFASSVSAIVSTVLLIDRLKNGAN
ncbi:hypothetical protein [Gracilimonas mengyeensis]|uniref:Soluble ligand binding domain-containing protein n=1 Tax=Gracilimonas mengyeensis TaxID=1302730 RepID=A0A521BZX6_9BACT|nr:hypothetical protein [Gracilimonas mengyeensis]SMO52776.1 hypothetical protein SAMN06265219_10432 [Gracilimonas mengyeensis]